VHRLAPVYVLAAAGVACGPPAPQKVDVPAVVIAPVAAEPPVIVGQSAEAPTPTAAAGTTFALEDVAPQNWAGHHANVPINVNSIWAESNIVLAAGNGGVLRSTDRGLHWTLIGQKSISPVLGGSSIDDLYMGSGYELYRSTDRGLTWTSIGRAPGTVQNIWSDKPDSVWALGGAPNFLQHSSDHGKTWQLSGQTVGSGWLYDMAVTKNGLLLAGKDESTSTAQASLQRSTDNGKTWSRIKVPPNPPGMSSEEMRNVCVTDSGAIWVSEAYTVWVSRDNAKTWSLAVPVGTEILALECRGSTVIVGGRNKQTRITTDDGNRWRSNEFDGQLGVFLVAMQTAWIHPTGELFFGGESYAKEGGGTLMRWTP
jgi:photosystem II stability/assembly factor-like uncharacterized protein